MGYSDLHLHFDGSLPLDTVKVLAWLDRDADIYVPFDDKELRELLTYSFDPEKRKSSHGIYERVTKNGSVILRPEEYMDEEDLEKMKSDKETGGLSSYLTKFDLPLSLLQTEENISYAISALAIDLKKRGIDYAEVRFAPQLHTERGLTQLQVVQAMIDGYNRRLDFTDEAISRQTMLKLMEFENSIGVDLGLKERPDAAHIRFILCLMRGNMNDTAAYDRNMETVDIARHFMSEGNQLVAGLDLAGDESKYATADYLDFFGIARRNRIPFTIHAGEAAGADSVWEAIEMGASRIGHGVAAASDERLMNEIAKRSTVLEMCPTSNLQTGAVETFSEYPLRKFMEKGIRVTVNSDNMTVSGTDVVKEFELLGREIGLTQEEKNILIKYSEISHL